VYALYFSAILIFVRAHLLISTPYLHLDKYLHGQERLPFQRRLLPMVLLNAMLRIPIPAAITRGRHGIFAHPEQIYLFVFDLLSVFLASFLIMRLYSKLRDGVNFRLLVFPIFFFSIFCTYMLHSEANVYYPYDMLSLVFFTAGLYCIYTHRFFALLMLILVGTFNRETTMFLIPIFLLDAIGEQNGLRSVSWKNLPWAKTAVLGVAWLAVRLFLNHLYVHNDATEYGSRLIYNLRYLPPNNWPEILGTCGFLLPVIWFSRKRIPDSRISAWVLVLPLWFGVMYYYGVITETRIFGELCPIVALATTLLFERYVKDKALTFTDKRDSSTTSAAGSSS
jgi:hypothetical protein